MKKFLVALTLFATAFAVQGQQLKVSVGSKTGTYMRMFSELNQACGTHIRLEGLESSGSVENLDRLVGNEVNAAWTQTDVIWLRSKTDDLSNVKTLFAMHPEELHIVARSAPIMEGMVGFRKEIVLDSVADLAGRKVGAAGGSVVSARVVQLLGEVGFTIVPFPDTDAAIAGLAAKQVDAVLAVGGAPLPNLAKLGAEYKLLSIGEKYAGKMKEVYVPAKVSYPKMNSSGVPTVATEALFVTRDYKSAGFVTALAKVRGCLADTLDDLKEGTGKHPKWSAVNLANRGKWLYYELPTVARGKK